MEPTLPGDATLDDSASDDATAGDASATDSDADEARPADTAPGDTSVPPNDHGVSEAAGEKAAPDAAAHSDWDRVGDADSDSASDDAAGKVLEVPQVVQSEPPQPSADGQAQTASEAGEAQDAGDAQNAGGDQNAGDAGDPPPDEVGSISDYQDEQEDSAVMGVYVVPVPLGPVGISPYAANSYPSVQGSINPGFLPGFVPGAPFGTVNVRSLGSGMNSAIMRTSPMFPRSSMRFSGGMHFSGGMFGRAR